MTESQTPISSKPPCSREDALLVVKRLRENGHIAYFAGGCVRDELLGIAPKDYDVATDAPPQRVRELFKNTQAVGAAFGVILVRQGKSVVEVATFRSDGAYLDGRRPSEVHFTTAEEDAKRRDFTINGLFLDPIDNRVIDFVNGQEDLKNKVLRAIGEPDLRFGEDYLRLLRAVRFAARFNLTIEPGTSAAIKRHAEHLKRISPERIAEELRLMLTTPTRGQAYRLLHEFELDRVILRFLPDSGEFVGLFCAVFAPSVSFGLALAALILDARGGRLPTPADVRGASKAMRQTLRISNQENDELEGSFAFVQFLGDRSLSVAGMKRFLAQPTSRESRLLMEALGRIGIQYGRVQLVLEQLNELEKTDYAPAPLITGDDLTAAGLKPGKLFKQILDEVYDAQLESRVNSKDDAMQLAMRIARSAELA